MLEFRGSVVTSEAGLLAYRDMNLTMRPGLSETARLAGYEDVNGAERLRHDPAMGWIVGGKAAPGCAASPSQIGRFETHGLTAQSHLSALSDPSGRWIDQVHGRRPPRGVVFDMDSSVSPTHNEQEMSVWNGHYDCTCYHPLFVPWECL